MLDKKLNIIHFGQKNCNSREGGVEVFVHEVAKRQVKFGNIVTCINRKTHHIGGKQYDKERINELDGINIKYVPTIDKKGLAALTSSFFASIMAAFSNCDIVHIHAEGPGFFSFIPKLFKKKVVCHIHGLDWKRNKWSNSFASKFIKQGEKNIVKFADAIIVLSKNMQNYFIDEYNIKTTLIENGVAGYEKIDAELIQEKFGLSSGEYILYLSRLVPEKRADLLIDVYNSLNTNKKLVIAGSPSDSDDYFRSLIDKANKNMNIIFTGFVEGNLLKELYSNSFIYILPSELEGMPLTLLEAMSYGNYCIVSDIPELTEVIGNNGLTFKLNDFNDLKSKIDFALKNEKGIKEEKEKIKEYVINKYSWDTTTCKIMELYKKVLNV